MCAGQLGCCLTHFASREAMDIEGLGDETARQLIEHNLVKDVSDLFRLKVEDLQSLPGFAEAIWAEAISSNSGLHATAIGPLSLCTGYPTCWTANGPTTCTRVRVACENS